MLPHSLTNLLIFNKFYKAIIKMNQELMAFIQETICLKKIKDGAYVINLDEYADVGIYWVAYFVIEVKLFISIVLVLNMFLKKLKNLLGIKT